MPRWRPDQPYNDLPAPPGAERLETRRVLKATIGARAAVAQLDQASRAIPNPTVLINTIPLLEAQASSEIENVVTTTDDLFRHVDDDTSANPTTRETLRYRTALNAGYLSVSERGLTVGTAEKVCSTIKDREMSVRTLPGTRIADARSDHIIYSPPEGADLLAAKLSEWERFIHSDDGMDPLVRMAAAHYQFEAIHPFTDGNGRTGRILNVLLLVEAGLLHLPVLYLSRYLIRRKNDYYRLLSEVTASGAWEEWILYILTGVEQTSAGTVRKISAIRDLQGAFHGRARAASSGGSDSELLAVLFEQPYARIGTVMDRCGVSRPTATRWLSDLAEAGLLMDRKIGRDRVFINREYLDLLAREEAP